jgi:hypothetical protein
MPGELDIVDDAMDLVPEAERLVVDSRVVLSVIGRLGRIIEARFATSGLGAAEFCRFCDELAGTGAAGFVYKTLDRFGAGLSLDGVEVVAPVTVPERFRVVEKVDAFPLSVLPGVLLSILPRRLVRAMLLAVCLTIILAGLAFPLPGTGLALNSRFLANSSCSFFSFSSIMALRFANIASPGNVKVGRVGVFDDLGFGGGGGNCIDIGLRFDAK